MIIVIIIAARLAVPRACAAATQTLSKNTGAGRQLQGRRARHAGKGDQGDDVLVVKASLPVYTSEAKDSSRLHG